MSDAAGRIAENLAQVRQRITAAAQRSGRAGDTITMVAVTKYVPIELIAPLIEAGCTDLGESRPQELWSKAAKLGNPQLRWHMIGHLQRNKLRRTLPLLHLLQSVDSRRLLTALNDEAAERAAPIDVLLEVNISGDVTKTGLQPSEMPLILERAAELQHVHVRGLMGMASLVGGEETAQRDFARLNELRIELAKNCPAAISLSELSMGMSGDFEVAIEHGATIVRVGSALFDGVAL